MQIDDLGRRVLLPLMITYRMQESIRAQTHATIEEQRVVTVPRVVGHLPGRSAGQLVGSAFDEILEGEAAIEVAGMLDQGTALIGALRRLRFVLGVALIGR